MHPRFIRRNRRTVLVSALLLALTWRALVPAGFMPASDGSMLLQPCPEGMPGMVIEQDPAHPHGDHHTEHCPFGAAPFAAPLPCIALTPPTLASAPQLERPFTAPHFVVRIARAHQPRAPPELA